MRPRLGEKPTYIAPPPPSLLIPSLGFIIALCILNLLRQSEILGVNSDWSIKAEGCVVVSDVEMAGSVTGLNHCSNGKQWWTKKSWSEVFGRPVFWEVNNICLNWCGYLRIIWSN